ncbi:hypothetical protein K4F52_005608 [Lecanicillium sp. MT-2017a]|nr:hypothetical protein K4F52_005608 [Lecanicillium sp. MT-2017a]
MAPDCILSLPTEAILTIAHHLQRFKDISSLSRSHPRLHTILNPEIYRIDARAFDSRALFWAALHGSHEVAHKALQAGTDVDVYCGSSGCARDWRDQAPEFHHDSTPLLIATTYGHLNIVSLLLEAGADQGWMDDFEDTALLIACARGHTDIVRLLLSRSDADINVANARLETPLIRAAKAGHLELVQLLLEQDAIDLELADDKGTALFHAGVAGHEDVFNAIHDRGATVYGMALSGSVPDFAAVCALRGSRSLALANDMLAAGASMQAEFQHEQTPMLKACAAGNLPVIKMLCSKGFDLSADTKEVQACIWSACGLPDPATAHFLLSQGAVHENASRSLYQTPLHNACRRGGSLDIIQELLTRGSDPALYNYRHQTAFDWAAERRDSDVLGLLLAHCAGRDLGDVLGGALLAACSRNRVENVRMLLDAGADPNYHTHTSQTPLVLACYPADSPPKSKWRKCPTTVAIVTMLLDAGADIKVTAHSESRHVLHYACTFGLDAVVDLLLRRGAVVQEPAYNFPSLLHCACISGCPSIVTQLIDLGLDPLVREAGQTTLHVACGSRYAEEMADVVDILLKCGVDPVGVTADRISALDLVCSNRFLLDSGRIVEALLAQGVAYDAEAQSRTTPLFEACRSGNFGAAKALVQHGADASTFGCRGIEGLTIRYGSILKLILSLGVGFTGNPILSCHSGGLRVFRQLVAHGFDPFSTAANGETVLHRASSTTDSTRHFIEHLLRLGLDPNATEDVDHCTPLHFAAQFGSMGTIVTLVESGNVNLDATTRSGFTAYELALDNRHFRACDYLAAKGASIPNPQEADPDTPTTSDAASVA